jgi:hypothetical protein
MGIRNDWFRVVEPATMRKIVKNFEALRAKGKRKEESA